MADTGPERAEHPLSFGPLWRRTAGIVRDHGELLWPLAGVMFFLPQLLFAMVEPERAPGARFGFEASLPVMAVLLTGLLLTVIGQLAVAFLAVHDGTAELSFGQVIGRAGSMMLPGFALLLMQGLATFAGILLLILPGLLLFARFSVALPLLATETRDPVMALKKSWDLTEGHTFRILVTLVTLLAGVFLFYAGFLSLGILLGSPEPLSASVGQWSIGRWIMELLATTAVTVIAVVSVCFYSSLLLALQGMRKGRG